MSSRLESNDNSWDYRGENTKEFTHCLHSYPAMMIPQLARRLINSYGIKDGWLLDPYCGTGTSLVEASLYGMNAVGCDINPLVRLIAEVKTTPIPIDALDAQMSELNNLLETGSLDSKIFFKATKAIPQVLNIDYWFSEKVKQSLARIRFCILGVEDDAIRSFLLVAFSETVRDCSNTRNGEFKLYRMSECRLQSHNPDVVRMFFSKVERNKQGLLAYMEKKKLVDTSVHGTNTVAGQKPAGRTSYDLVVTSPPYGDSSTTVAYGQFSRLSADWLELKEAQCLDRRAMGGMRRQISFSKDTPVGPQIEEIRLKDEARAKQVEAFYADFNDSIETVASMVSPGGTVCYVVGNRCVKGEVLPTDAFVVHAFCRLGFTHEITYIRNIPNKRMPKRNSPSNQQGKTMKTMSHEYIVICHKDS